MKKAIMYYRVSTGRQGVSGLGLNAQKQAVQAFAKANEFILTSEFIEVESGRKEKRPILLKALDACKKEHAILLIARLDRLGRNVAFISKLMEAGIDFKAVDNPYANKLIVHIMAAFAEHERDLISKRTTDALQVAKAKGVALGTYGREVLSAHNRQEADKFAVAMLPVIHEMQTRGIITIRAMVEELNKCKVATYRQGGTWHLSTVHSILKRQHKRT